MSRITPPSSRPHTSAADVYVMCRHEDNMNPFFESFQKEIGKKSAQIIIIIIAISLLAAAKLLPEYMTKLRLLSIFLLSMLLLALASGLLFRYLSYRNSKNINQTDKINKKEFTLNPHGYYTHPDYSFHICITCLETNNLISPVLNGYCTVCDKPTSETLVSGGDVFTIPDE